MAPYIVITTQFGVYKCHDCRIKNNRVYFNSRAVNQATVATIVDKNGVTIYENKAITPYNARKLTSKARSSEASAKKQPVKAAKSAKKDAPKKKSTLPDVIQL